jgi:hypothetical protein
MKHVVFALFDESEPAAHALRHLRLVKRGYPGAPMEVALHRGHLDGERLPLFSTNGRRRALLGVANGLFWGSLIGVILHVSGTATAAFGLLVAFTASLGAVIGALGGVLTGVSSPDDALAHLAGDLHGREVAISFTTSDDALFVRAQNVFVEHGARVERRVAI